MTLMATSVGFLGMKGISGAVGGTAAVPTLAGLVDQRAAGFILESRAGLEFLRQNLPNNQLLAQSTASTLWGVRHRMSVVPKRPHEAEEVAISIVASAFLSIVGALTTFNATENVFYAGGVAAGIALAFNSLISISYHTPHANRSSHPPLLLRLLKDSRFIHRRRASREWSEITEQMEDAATMERFFAAHPKEYLDFLRGSVSETFRSEEAKAKMRIDQLKAKVAEARRMEEQRLREIRGAGISTEVKKQLSARVRSTTEAGLAALEEAVKKEEAFANRLGDFISEVADMTGAIQQEVAVANIYAEVEQHADAMEALTEAALRVEEARIGTILDLAAYWQRLRKMGDEVVNLQLSQREVQQLLETPET